MKKRWIWLAVIVLAVVVLLWLYLPRNVSGILKGVMADGDELVPCEVALDGWIIRPELQLREYRGELRISSVPRTFGSAEVQFPYGTDQLEYLYYRDGAEDYGVGYVVMPKDVAWLYIWLEDGREIAVSRDGENTLESVRQAAQELTRMELPLGLN